MNDNKKVLAMQGNVEKFVDASGGAFIINVTQDEDENYVADKTFAEISEALANGQMPYCVMGNYVYILCRSTNFGKDFTSICAGKVRRIFIQINDDVTYVEDGTIQFVTT